jgi:hypothetical protein
LHDSHDFSGSPSSFNYSYLLYKQVIRLIAYDKTKIREYYCIIYPFLTRGAQWAIGSLISVVSMDFALPTSIIATESLSTPQVISNSTIYKSNIIWCLCWNPPLK